MTGLLPKKGGGSWKFPKKKTVLAAAGLHTIKNMCKYVGPASCDGQRIGLS